MLGTRRKFVRVVAWVVGLVAAGAAVPEVAAQPRLNGIDVSHWQGAVNWTNVKNSGRVFAFAKATEGTTFTDGQFARNWSEMKRVGLIRGAYHYGHPDTSAITQATRFVNVVRPKMGDLQLVLDIEDADGRTPAQVWSWVQTFIAEIQRRTGRPGIIYTGYYFWRDQVGDPANNLNCPLWIARYGASAPLVPRAWTTWTFWQYSSTGSVPGVSGNCDLDYFNGTITQLRRLTLPVTPGGI